MKPILKWQYEQLMKELLLLQEHISDPHCPCESMGEMCVRKHLLTIEAYAEETIPIEEDPKYADKLLALADQAREFRLKEEQTLCGRNPVANRDLLLWARNMRKEFEAYSLACENVSQNVNLIPESERVQGEGEKRAGI
jgi:hypothetical protein